MGWDDDRGRFESESPPKKGRSTLARGERRLGEVKTEITPRMLRVLRLVGAFLLHHRHGPQLADINRGLCEAPDHQGVIRTLAALRSRGMLTWRDRDYGTLRLTDAGEKVLGPIPAAVTK